MPNILIMPTTLRHRPGRYREILGQAGFTPIDPAGTGKLSASDLHATLPEADALLAWGAPITAEMIALAPRLRVIARAGTGIDAVDVAAASARRIAVSNTPGANAESVAEQTFALLLALTRNVLDNDRTVRAGGWDRRPGRPLRGTTLGIVGPGRIGRAVARRAIAFGMRVLASGRDGQSGGPLADAGIERIASGRPAGRVGRRQPASEPDRRDPRPVRPPCLRPDAPGALFLNTARGGLVVERDLIESLASGHLGGAGLDVQELEPPAPDNPLLALPNVVFSPHVGAVDRDALDRMAEQAADCVVALYRGRWPEGFVINEEIRSCWQW